MLLGSGGSVKPLNQQVLERIRSNGQISRRDVAKILGVSPASITASVSTLVDRGLVRESLLSHKDTGRGRPPVALEIVPEALAVVGMTLSDGHHDAVICDFAGNTLVEAQVPAASGRRPLSVILAEVATLLEAVLKESGLTHSQVAGIGVALPGFIDHATGFVHWSPLLIDKKVHIRTLLHEHLNFRVHIDNDVNALALAESWYGVGREMSDFAVVTIENGVGMGLVMNNQLYRGALGLGLELGHTTVQYDGALCRCGQRGCLEAYVADYALVREASTALEWDGYTARTTAQVLEILFDQAKAGNPAARLIFNRAGKYLSAGLANVIRLFDPELLILSGARLRYDYLYAEEVLSETHRFSDSIGRARTSVAIHSWGELAWARGAAVLALSAVTDELTWT